ncbi:nf-x1 finger and helicase domain containing protein [Anopheles sinensis]|uniref:Nf-x1 finger and helicase domain containing protein n=1 Tax=Anopheles sinensis TaxID=74873 RepID=A0A084VZX3_ANOSI|nr:nf-x1 finger and helicase domain containing protein [Anopheles sinensis]
MFVDKKYYQPSVAKVAGESDPRDEHYDLTGNLFGRCGIRQPPAAVQPPLRALRGARQRSGSANTGMCLRGECQPRRERGRFGINPYARGTCMMVFWARWCTPRYKNSAA